MQLSIKQDACKYRNFDGYVFGNVDAISVHAHEKCSNSGQKECNELKSNGYKRHHVNNAPSQCHYYHIVIMRGKIDRMAREWY
ncbi:hypothetical protein QE152_g23698 [Popillia japonica]|uniref:Uncharacterized protein n=1 Tax=Popillia japonica TaxID=7064 RepID=A0AAW1KHK6_POPJA